jgi:hypothetical protein
MAWGICGALVRGLANLPFPNSSHPKWRPKADALALG